MTSSEDRYREILLDHFRHPRNKNPLVQAQTQGRCLNPSCGDLVECKVNFADERVNEISVQSSGCTMAVASASFMSEVVKGLSLAEIQKLYDQFRQELKKSLAEDWQLAELESFRPLRRNPSRHPCALIGWEALHQAFKNLETKSCK